MDASPSPNITPDQARALINQVFAVPYRRNPAFTGRVDFLRSLKEKLFNQAGHGYHMRVALYGPSGIGKTQIALAYVHAYKHLYKSVYWIPAQTMDSLADGWRRVACAEGLQFREGAGPAQMNAAMVSWLNKQKSWLLVYDRLDVAALEANAFPKNDTMKHTIITTRNGDSGRLAEWGMEVPVLNGEEAIQLLSNVSGISLPPESPERNAAEWVLKELGYLPLAVNDAGMYIKEICGTLEAYIKELKSNREILLSRRPVDNTQYPYSVNQALARPLLHSEDPKPAAKQSRWKFWRN